MTQERFLKKISEVPIDPLTLNEYAYSTTNTRQEYELGSITESLISNNSVLDITFPIKAYADNSFYTYVKWNYNKQIVTVEQTDRLYVLWVPTIITTEINSVTVEEVLNNQSFAVSGSKNLPASYADSLPLGQSHTWSTSFTPGSISLTAPVVYEWRASDLNNAQDKQDLWENIVSYYSNSNVSDKPEYKWLSTIDSGKEFLYVNTLISSDIGWLTRDTLELSDDNSVVVVRSSWGWDITPVSCVDMTDENLANLNNWMSVSLQVGRNWTVVLALWNPAWTAELGTSSLTKAEWCSITLFRYQWSDAGGELTYIPEEFGYLDKLTQFEFSFQAISQIPETFTNLENVTSFDFRFNNGLWALAQDAASLWILAEGATTLLENLGDIVCQLWISDTWRGICVERKLIRWVGEFFSFSVSDTDISTWWDSGSDWWFWGEGWEGWGDSYPWSCAAMTPWQLSNLNNWMEVTVTARDAWGFDGNAAPIFSTPDFVPPTIAEWCSITHLNANVPWGQDQPWVWYLPTEIGYLENLEEINIFNQWVSEIPESFTLLQNIEEFNFSGNVALNELNSVSSSLTPNFAGMTCARQVTDLNRSICVEPQDAWGFLFYVFDDAQFCINIPSHWSCS